MTRDAKPSQCSGDALAPGQGYRYRVFAAAAVDDHGINKAQEPAGSRRVTATAERVTVGCISFP